MSEVDSDTASAAEAAAAGDLVNILLPDEVEPRSELLCDLSARDLAVTAVLGGDLHPQFAAGAFRNRHNEAMFSLVFGYDEFISLIPIEPTDNA